MLVKVATARAGRRAMMSTTPVVPVASHANRSHGTRFEPIVPGVRTARVPSRAARDGAARPPGTAAPSRPAPPSTTRGSGARRSKHTFQRRHRDGRSPACSVVKSSSTLEKATAGGLSALPEPPTCSSRTRIHRPHTTPARPWFCSLASGVEVHAFCCSGPHLTPRGSGSVLTDRDTRGHLLPPLSPGVREGRAAEVPSGP
jgi:hypothetical protein